MRNVKLSRFVRHAEANVVQGGLRSVIRALRWLAVAAIGEALQEVVSAVLIELPCRTAGSLAAAPNA